MMALQSRGKKLACFHGSGGSQHLGGGCKQPPPAQVPLWCDFKEGVPVLDRV